MTRTKRPYQYRWTMISGDTELHAVKNDGTGYTLCGVRSSSWLDTPPGGVRAYLKCQGCNKNSGAGGQLRDVPASSVLSDAQTDVLIALELSSPVGGMRLSGVPADVKAWLLAMRVGLPVSLAGDNPKWTITDAGRTALRTARHAFIRDED